jgi:hypothetical protein
MAAASAGSKARSRLPGPLLGRHRRDLELRVAQQDAQQLETGVPAGADDGDLHRRASSRATLHAVLPATPLRRGERVPVVCRPRCF